LERVYLDEIGHVKHGLLWFNRWRNETTPSSSERKEDDWEAYVRILPLPLTPRRAKGLSFTVEGRRQAGLSDRFIRELDLYSGSKGRPPVLWHLDPLCDEDYSPSAQSTSLTLPKKRLTSDLQVLPTYLAKDAD